MRREKVLFLNILHQLLLQPTAPFQEFSVATTILRLLQKEGYHPSVEPHGNVLVSTSPLGLYPPTAKPVQGKKPFLPTLVFSAHTDHPGFALSTLEPHKSLLKVLGGVPYQARNFHFVRVHNPHQPDHPLRLKVEKIIRRKKEVFVEVAKKPGERIFRGASITLDIPPFRKVGNLIHARSLDDLAGCAALISLFTMLKRRRRAEKEASPTVIGVFTRAEEVGCVGLASLIQSRFFHKDWLYYSVETSKALSATSEVSKGCTVRLGDRATLFDPWLTRFTLHVAQNQAQAKSRGPDRPFRYQRALLDGGSCEATPLVLSGFQATGLALPLGNYHNFDPRHKTIRPEFIHLHDYYNLITLMTALVHAFPSWAHFRETFCETILPRGFSRIGELKK